MKVRIAIRGFAGGKLQFEDRVDVDHEYIDNMLPDLARKHARALASKRLHHIEIEFLDELNPNERFYRFGTDPRGMLRPIRVDLVTGGVTIEEVLGSAKRARMALWN